MKKLMIYTMTALFAMIAVSIAAPDKDAMMAKEMAAWQAFKNKNADDFKKVVAADFLGVYAEGVSDMKKELDDMQKWDMKSFAISDYTAVASGADTMMSTYKFTVEGTYDGKDVSGTYNAGSVWKMNKGAWQAIFHTNVMVESAAELTGQLPTPSPAVEQPTEETMMPPDGMARKLQEIQRLPPAERLKKLQEMSGLSPAPNLQNQQQQSPDSK
jgi:hypothetical protein